jgi:hypothetical protein
MSTHPCGAELWGVLIFYLIEFYAAWIFHNEGGEEKRKIIKTDRVYLESLQSFFVLASVWLWASSLTFL